MPIRPRYVARDLKPLDFDQTAERRQPAPARHDDDQCAPYRHLVAAACGKFEDHETPDQESNPNGNAVSLEVEMIKVSDTQAQFQAAANLYAKAMTHDEDGHRPLIA